MGNIIETAIYSAAGKLFLFFVIVPVGIIFLGYVLHDRKDHSGTAEKIGPTY